MLKMKLMQKQFDARVEKLEDVSLENVSGGMDSPEILAIISFIGTGLGTVTSLGCSIAGLFCQDKTAKGLQIATISGAGLSLVGCGALAVAVYQANKDDDK